MKTDDTLSEWEQESKNLLDTMNELPFLKAYGPYTLLPNRVLKLIDLVRKKDAALFKISKPENWKHKEPDAVTQLGCLMHQADEALALTEQLGEEEMK